MRILSIKINQGFFSRKFEFSDRVNLVYSEKNSVGKTTLLRLIFWGMGYEIPATKKFNFDKCFTQIFLELDNSDVLEIFREKDILTVRCQGKEDIYLLPMEASSFFSRIYNCGNEDVLNNILGAIYLDQEKGWTLLNRGCVIGKISFNLESLIRGLSDIDCDDLIDEEKRISFEILKYKKMLDIAEYQRQINQDSGNLVYEEKNEEIRTKLNVLRFQQYQIEDEIKQVSAVIKQNNSFKSYIEKMRLTVVSATTGEEVPVNKNTIKGFEDIQNIALARKKIQLLRLREVTKKIEELTASFDNTDTLDRVETLISTFDKRILQIPINAVAVANVIEQLKKRKKEVHDLIASKTKRSNSVVSELHEIAFGYIQELGVAKFANSGEGYLFTSDLKSLSGAVLHLTVFAFKLAYIKEIEKKLGIFLPIVIDSPTGKEVTKENVQKMLDILERDFKKNQVIIASIHLYNIDGIEIHTIEKALLEQDF